ncbi:hypothetical protein BUMB_05315c [Candidatus Paraburkholderia calva]|nr:hypothetical protein BUMB_05315c [Candidatus Paraburkholderia calva]
MLLASGAVWSERAWAQWRIVRIAVVALLAIGFVFGAAVVLPVAPPYSSWWRWADQHNGGNFNEELGWPELARSVAALRDTLAPGQRSGIGILAADSAQAEAIDL